MGREKGFDAGGELNGRDIQSDGMPEKRRGSMVGFLLQRFMPKSTIGY
jgi:hypothetical protein